VVLVRPWSDRRPPIRAALPWLAYATANVSREGRVWTLLAIHVTAVTHQSSGRPWCVRCSRNTGSTPSRWKTTRRSCWRESYMYTESAADQFGWQQSDVEDTDSVGVPPHWVGSIGGDFVYRKVAPRTYFFNHYHVCLFWCPKRQQPPIRNEVYIGLWNLKTVCFSRQHFEVLGFFLNFHMHFTLLIVFRVVIQDYRH